MIIIACLIVVGIGLLAAQVGLWCDVSKMRRINK
jgi:hypothetical protein